MALQDAQVEQDTFSKQYDAEQAQQKAQEQQAKQPPSLISQFMTGVGKATTGTLDWAISAADTINGARERAAHDIGAGVASAVANTGDQIGRALTASGKGMAAAEDPEHADDAMAGTMPTSPLWDHARGAIMDFRDAVAVKDPTLADNLVQSGAQLAVPFVGYSRMLSGVHGLANMVAANALTDATALGPHDTRMADIISLGRHVEGKLGDALRTLAPDGSAMNAYINYLAAPRYTESDSEGTFKNVLDGFGANLIATPLLHAAGMVLKQGTAALRYAVENGVGQASDITVPKIGTGPNQTTVAEGYKRLPPGLTKEQYALERERIASLRDREEGVTREFTPEPIPRRAAEVEGEAARRDRADPNPSGGFYPGELEAFLEEMKNPTPTTGKAPAPLPTNVVDMFSRRGLSLTRKRSTPSISTADYSPDSPTAAGPAADAPTTPGDIKNDALIRTVARQVNASSKTATGGSVADTISTLHAGMDDSTEQGAFYKELLGRLKDKNLQTSIVPSHDPMHSAQAANSSGSYHPADDTLAMHPGAYLGTQKFLHVFTHEATHAATMSELHSNPQVVKAMSSIIADAKASPAIAALKKQDRYGLTNPVELTAEAESNPRLQKALKDTPSKHGGTLWDDYKATIGGILGLSAAAIASPHFDELLTKEKTGA